MRRCWTRSSSAALWQRYEPPHSSFFRLTRAVLPRPYLTLCVSPHAHQALNERLGRAVGTALADASKGSLTPQRVLDDLAAALTAPEAALAKVTRQEAELRAELRALQEDVLQRARDARSSVAAPPGGEAWAAAPREAAAAEPAAGEEPPPKSLRATIEELRAEVETTRREVTGLQTPGQASDS
jgi:cell division protein FtsB